MKALCIIPILVLVLCNPASAQPAGDSSGANMPVEYSLHDLFAMALERSERVKISEEDVVVAERERDKARAALLPGLAAFWDYTRYSKEKEASSSFGTFSIQPESATLWGLRLYQTFSLGGREITSYNISRKGIEQSIHNFAAVSEDYLLEVAVRYFNVLKAQKATEIAMANEQRLKKYRDEAAIKLKIGEVTRTLLLRAEAELSGAQSELVKAENLLTFTRADLARFAGISREFAIKEYDLQASDFLADSGLESLRETAFSNRPEMRSAAVQKKIAEDQVSVARAAHWPLLTVEGVYARRDEEPSSPFFNEESIYGILRLDLPLFEGGLRRAEVREAEARKRQADLSFADVKKTIGLQVAEAYLNVETQKGVLKSLTDQVTFARENFVMVEKQFRFGLASSLDVLDANTLLVTSERELSRARYNYQFAIVQLRRATGSLLETLNGSFCLK